MDATPALQAAEQALDIPRKKRSPWPWVGGMLLALFVVGPLLLYLGVRLANPNAGARNIRVSQETTHLTEPLDAEGFVDYLAAVNQHASLGVTPENNAAVLLLQAVGPPPMLTATEAADFYLQLGVDPLPEEGDYFVPADEFAREHLEGKVDSAADVDTVELPSEWFTRRRAALDEAAAAEDWDALHAMIRTAPPADSPEELLARQIRIASDFPWRRPDYPELAGFLDRNRQPLDLFVAASQRPRCFFPLVTDADTLRLCVASTDLHSVHQLLPPLQCRATLLQREGDFKGAGECLLAVHRFARLKCGPPTVLERLMAGSWEGRAYIADRILFADRRLPAAASEEMQAALYSLPPMQPISVCLDQGERLQFLEAVIDLARRGSIADVAADGGREASPLVDAWNDRLVDWNEVLIAINQHFDRIVAYSQAPRGPARDAAGRQLEQELEQAVRDKSDPGLIARSLLSGDARRKVVQGRLLSVMAPAVQTAADSQFRVDAERALTLTVAALAGYRLQHGEYPAHLADLPVELLPQPAVDPFSGGLLIYRRTPRGYELYSVGQNGEDDGGPRQAEEIHWQDRDLVVEMPPRVDAVLFQ